MPRDLGHNMHIFVIVIRQKCLDAFYVLCSMQRRQEFRNLISAETQSGSNRLLLLMIDPTTVVAAHLRSIGAGSR